MQCANALEATIAMGAIELARCTDLKPLQADVADLKSQVRKPQSEVGVTRNSAESTRDSPRVVGI
jgi:hypothetical protein